MCFAGYYGLLRVPNPKWKVVVLAVCDVLRPINKDVVWRAKTACPARTCGFTTSILKSLDCDPCKLTGSATKQISRLVWRNQSNCRKWETNFSTFYKPAHYIGSIKYLNSRKNYCIERLKFVIQNRCDKVVIELRLLQLSTEIAMILVISNQTCGARSFDLKSSVWFQT